MEKFNITQKHKPNQLHRLLSALGGGIKALPFKGKSLLAITAFCLLAISLNAQTFITPTGTGGGTSWDDAAGFSSLETAVEAGGTVHVAEGTYNISNTFDLGGTNVDLIGGYPITSTGTDLSGYDPVANQTIFDGTGMIYGMFTHPIGSSNITIKGLVLQNATANQNGALFDGRASGTGNEVNWLFEDLKVQNNGLPTTTAAFYVHDVTQSANSTIVFRNCDFTNNNSGDGGALKIERVFLLGATVDDANTGNFLIDGCSFFENNSNNGKAGALHIRIAHGWTIQNTSFCDNIAGSIGGGAMMVDNCFNMIMDGCNFSNNQTSNLFGEGGAMYVQKNSYIYMDNTNFVGNFTLPSATSGRGGAIFSTQCAVVMNNCGFYDNQAYDGGAISSDRRFLFSGTEVANRAIGCVFSNNEARNNETNQTGGLDGGGAVKIQGGSTSPSGYLSWEFTNTTFVNNKVPANGWGGAIVNQQGNVIIDGCIFFNNTRGGDATITGADIKKHTNFASGFDPITNSSMQLASEADYTNVLSSGTAGINFTTGNTFSNTTDPGIVAPDPIVCGVLVVVPGNNSTTSKDDFNNTPYGIPVSADVSINDVDEEGNIQTFTLDGGNGGMALTDGTVVINSEGGYTFTPANGFSGNTEFSYSVCDDGVPSVCDTSKVYIEVFEPISVTSAQVIANPDANSIKQNSTGTGNVLANDLDPDGLLPAVTTLLNNQVVAGVDEDGNAVPNAGTLTLNTDGTYTFEPATDFIGTVTQAYTICNDGSPTLVCDDSELILEVVPDGDNTTFANDDAITTDAEVNAIGDVTINDSDSESDNQSIEGFSYDSDGDGQTDTKTTGAGLGSPIQIAGTDRNGDPVLNAGDLTLNADGTYLFEPATDFSGNAVIEYEICDDGSPKACAEATLVITVLAVKRDYGDAPVIYADAWHRKMTDADDNNVLDGATDIWLGTKTDFETSQSTNATATGDTNDDAMTFGSGTGQFPLSVIPGETFDVNITVNSTAPDNVYYGMWIDWDTDGVYDDFYSGSKETASPAIATITITAPSSIGSITNIRLRVDDVPLSTQDYQGGKSNGEVEDYQATVALPVELISFTGKAVNCEVQLNWTSATEENFSHYELEWSNDGREFRAIEEINGSGNSTFDLHYQYQDNRASDLNYYRLKMIDFDESFEYSDLITVKTGCNTSALKIYPNPLPKGSGTLSVKFYASEEETKFEISDMLGRVVKRITLGTAAGMKNAINWDISDLPSGTYQINAVGATSSNKFIIQE